MESDVEKLAMLVMKSRKRRMTEGGKQPNQVVIKTLIENESYEYLGILEIGYIKYMEIKLNDKKEYLRRIGKLHKHIAGTV